MCRLRSWKGGRTVTGNGRLDEHHGKVKARAIVCKGVCRKAVKWRARDQSREEGLIYRELGERERSLTFRGFSHPFIPCQQCFLGLLPLWSSVPSSLGSPSLMTRPCTSPGFLFFSHLLSCKQHSPGIPAQQLWWSWA